MERPGQTGALSFCSCTADQFSGVTGGMAGSGGFGGAAGVGAGATDCAAG